MIFHYILQSLFVAIGGLSVIASLFNWDWFFRSDNARFIVARAGRTRARWFYAFFGCLMMGTGIFFFLTLQGVI